MKDDHHFTLNKFEQALVDSAVERYKYDECFVCGRLGCVPLGHKARVLTHAEAIHYARNLMKNPEYKTGLGALLLARYIVEKL